MATLQEPRSNDARPSLEEELHELEREERLLERRTDGVEWWQWIAIVVSAFALAVAVFALTLALTDEDDDAAQSTAPAAQAGAAPAPAPVAPAPAATPPKAAPAVRKIPVELGEMYVKPSTDTVPAGKVKFVVRNVGKVEHELIVARKPLMMEGPGMPMHEQGLGMTEHMGPGGRETLTLNMKPGKYELFCNVPGHFAAGQRTSFSVTKQ